MNKHTFYWVSRPPLLLHQPCYRSAHGVEPDDASQLSPEVSIQLFVWRHFRYKNFIDHISE